jgi:hypothetical protein
MRPHHPQPGSVSRYQRRPCPPSSAAPAPRPQPAGP